MGKVAGRYLPLRSSGRKLPVSGKSFPLSDLLSLPNLEQVEGGHRMRLMKAMIVLAAVLDLAMFLQSPSSPLAA